MHLYKTTAANLLQHNGNWYRLSDDWDAVINQQNLYQDLEGEIPALELISRQAAESMISSSLLPPIGTQEVWAAGVTYLRSRDARMEESEDTGAADCYHRVYEAERPELFFKSMPHRVAGHKQHVHIRKDSTWNVPEPELTLFLNSEGTIQGYTIGNDMSSRSIEGENPLYLPQAKIYEYSAALGPCLYVPESPMPMQTEIRMTIFRYGEMVFNDSTKLSRMKRTLTELATYLYRELEFPQGCFLMTGTCVIPPNAFTLAQNDEVHITIDGIGTMINTVSIKK